MQKKCLLTVNDYKLCLNRCNQNHNIINISFDEFKETLKIRLIKYNTILLSKILK